MQHDDRIFLRTETRSVLWTSGDAPEHDSRELLPIDALRPYVERIRLGREMFEPAVVEHVLPDGAVHLFFDLGDVVRATAVGGTSAPTTLTLAGVHEQVGVQVRAGGMAALLGIPAGELAGRQVALDDLWGADTGALLDRLLGTPYHRRAAVVQQALLKRLAARARAADRTAAAAVTQVLAARGNLRVRALADRLGVGERRLEQLFHRDVGLSPKAFCRVTRFRFAVDALHARQEPSWPALADACGFCDQAHLINEFRAIAGLTPGQLAEFGFLQYGSMP